MFCAILEIIVWGSFALVFVAACVVAVVLIIKGIKEDKNWMPFDGEG